MRKLRVLVLGLNGMAGHLITDFFVKEDGYEIFGLEEELFLPANYNFITEINNFQPDIIINALRVVVQESEEYPQKAVFINSYVPKCIEKFYINSKVKIIHLSTDCVFSGEKGKYKETDIPDGKHMYSLTKYCGEIINNKDLTIRTSYIGPNQKNKHEELFDWFLNQRGEIDGYINVFWNGITTLELAKIIKQAIEKNICGLYHLCSEEKLSKFDLLFKIKNQWNKNDVLINEKTNQKIDRSLIDTRKKFKVIQYDKMFFDLYNYMENNQRLYSHYF